MLVFFTNLGHMEFQVRYLALFLLFSVIDSFGWFWRGSLHKNIQLMLEFLKAPLLVLLYIYDLSDDVIWKVAIYTLLMILLFTLRVINHLICDNNKNWFLNLNLIYETMDWGKTSHLISMLDKLHSFRLTGLITLVLLMWKWMGLFLRKNHLLRSWD